jgi:hypothetical protein
MVIIIKLLLIGVRVSWVIINLLYRQIIGALIYYIYITWMYKSTYVIRVLRIPGRTSTVRVWTGRTTPGRVRSRYVPIRVQYSSTYSIWAETSKCALSLSHVCVTTDLVRILNNSRKWSANNLGAQIFHQLSQSLFADLLVCSPVNTQLKTTTLFSWIIQYFIIYITVELRKKQVESIYPFFYSVYPPYNLHI